MKLLLVFTVLFSIGLTPNWQHQEKKGYTIYYQSSDAAHIDDYSILIKKGIKRVKKFFSSSFENNFSVYVHPDRSSLDSTWQHDWKMPEFKSECWMVASGIADRLDLISPAQWKPQSCEHDYANKEETQRLITHELVHVYHAQHNKSKDFSETENIDWFIEGLAAYASGQVTETKLSEVKQAAKDGKTPASLNDFWKGKLRYQLSGSVVMYIDKTYGRKKLRSLLPFTKKSEIFPALGITEEALLSSWENFLLK